MIKHTVLTNKIRQFSITLLLVSYFISCHLDVFGTPRWDVPRFTPTSKESLTFPFDGLVYQNNWLSVPQSAVEQSRECLTRG